MWEYIEVLFRNSWAFFGLEYPGTGMTFGVILVGVFLVGFALNLLMKLLGLSGSVIPSSGGTRRIIGTLRRK